jgi:hypothetical protein
MLTPIQAAGEMLLGKAPHVETLAQPLVNTTKTLRAIGPGLRLTAGLQSLGRGDKIQWVEFPVSQQLPHKAVSVFLELTLAAI